MLIAARPHLVLALLALVGLGAPLVALAFGGLFSRFAADDYCTAGQVQMTGFIEAQARLYVGWSGRFAATLMVTLVELIGPLAVPFLPGLALVAWLATVTWAARESLRALGCQLALLPAAVLGTLVVFTTLRTTADLPQVLYWQTGMLTYLWPLVLATACVGWVAHIANHQAGPARWPIALGVPFALAFLAGGTSETFAVAEVTALASASGISLASAKRGGTILQKMLLAGLLGALLALAIVAVSPGNNVRQQTATQTPLSAAALQALEFTVGWLRQTYARPHAFVLLLLVGIPAAIGVTSAPARSISQQWIVPLAGVVASGLVILACMLPAFYALSSNPPGRALVIPQYVLVCNQLAVGWLLGTAVAARLGPFLGSPAPGRVALAALVVLLAQGPLLMTGEVLQTLAPARAYAANWDLLDREVRAERNHGVLDVTVRRLASTGLVQNLEFVGPNRSDWFNECVARYYDLNTIASMPGVP